MNEVDEMIGKKIRNWDVLNVVDSNITKYKRKYLCRCDCGKNKIVKYHTLKYLNYKSCGNSCPCGKAKRNIEFKLTKNRYGRITVVGNNLIYKNKRCYIECKCDCGKILLKNTQHLLTSKNPACSISCARSLKLEIIGKKFSRLKVINFCGVDEHGKYMFKCKCDCGTELKVSGSSLKKGNTKSCGCLSSEKSSLNLYLHNNYLEK